MERRLYQFCQSRLKQPQGKLKLSALVTRLHNEYGFGVIEAGYLYYKERDRETLIDRVKLENDNAHLFRNEYPQAQTRVQAAKTQRNEKHNSYPVSRDFVLVNSLQELRINQQKQPLSSITSLGLYLKADEISSVEHPQIILVENLAIMANLTALNIPDELQNALWLYRGDNKNQQKTDSAYQFFRRFKSSHQLICFSDLDAKGIEIALTSGADYWLTAQDCNVVNIELQGEENEWFEQSDALKYLHRQTALPMQCQNALTTMMASRKTLKQEQMVAHQIKLASYKLSQ